MTNFATSFISVFFNFGNGRFSIKLNTRCPLTVTVNSPAEASLEISKFPFNSDFKRSAKRVNTCHIFDTEHRGRGSSAAKVADDLEVFVFVIFDFGAFVGALCFCCFTLFAAIS